MYLHPHDHGQLTTVASEKWSSWPHSAPQQRKIDRLTASDYVSLQNEQCIIFIFLYHRLTADNKSVHFRNIAVQESFIEVQTAVASERSCVDCFKHRMDSMMGAQIPLATKLLLLISSSNQTRKLATICLKLLLYLYFQPRQPKFTEKIDAESLSATD